MSKNSSVLSSQKFFRVGSPVHVVANDYDYYGHVVSCFKKRKTDVYRYVVEDSRGRLFIHNDAQLHPWSGKTIDMKSPVYKGG